MTADGAELTVSVPSVRVGARLQAYLALTKPRIIELLLVTTLPAMILAARGWPKPQTVAATLLGGALAAGAANTLNCYFDRDLDERMRRTRRRPLPRHTVAPAAALVFAAGLAVAGTLLLGLAANWLAAGLADAAIGFYVLVYTLGLKRRTPSNIVIGGAAGCVPALVGWASVTGGVGWPAWVLFAVVFAWTPPHFWALALRYREDYAAAGVPMLPVVRAPAAVSLRIVAYTWLTVALSLLLVPVAGPVYLAVALVVGAGFLLEAHRLHARLRRSAARPAEGNPMRLFHYSIGYLSLLFVAAAVGAVLR